MATGRRWSRAALGPVVAIVAASAGCRWIPARRGGSAAEAPPPVIGTSGTAPARDEIATGTLPPCRLCGRSATRKPSGPAPPTPLLDAAANRDAALKQALAIEIDTPAPPGPRKTPPPLEVRVVATAPTTTDAAPTVRETSSTSKADADVKPAANDADLRPEDAPRDALPSPLPDPAPAPAPIQPPPLVPVPIERPEAEAAESSESTLWDSVLSALATPTGPPAAAEIAAPCGMSPRPPVPNSPWPICESAARCWDSAERSPSPRRPAGRARPSCCIASWRGFATRRLPTVSGARLTSSVAILPASGGEPVWSGDLGTAEDHCRRRRRDFFVNYRLTLPAGLAPGDYLVRIVQKDLLGDREASRTVPIHVSP